MVNEQQYSQSNQTSNNETTGMPAMENPGTASRRTVLKAIGAGAVISTGITGTATANPEGLGKYRDVSRAVEEGYVSTPCVPGMGVHYINFDLIDGDVKVSQPEALVYAQDGSELRYLGVEYLATEEFSLFGHHAHFIPELGVYGLHAWFFEKNDNGMHAELHSNVDENCNFVTE